MLLAKSKSNQLQKLVSYLLMAILNVAACHVASDAAILPMAVKAKRGMVVSVSSQGSEVGVAILQRGGTAVDAAVATALAMAVTYPQAGNIGGGGFMMIHPGDAAAAVCIDYRERAPAAATKTMFAFNDSRFGHKIVGVPGTVRGLALAHQKFGKLPWKELVQPAVSLAADGFLVDKAVARSLNGVITSSESKPFTEMLRVFAPPDGHTWKAGDRLIQPDLATTLQLIAEHGPDAFYDGPIAKRIVAEMKRGNGLITRADLANYQAKIRKPIHGNFRGFDVYGPPPPSSGGISLILMLNILENFDLKAQGRWSPLTMHLTIEAMRRAYLDRARHLGDQDFIQIPNHLTTKDYAATLARQMSMSQATRSFDLAQGVPPLAAEGESTTHFSIIDSTGTAVSNTYTLEFSFGSRVVVRGAGFLLNNEMGDFNWTPGHTDDQGRIGTKANQIAPGKRMLSSQTPTIVSRDGKAVLVTGSPGGRTIINTSLCMVLNVFEFDMKLTEAMAAPRLHHQWLPDRVRFEKVEDPNFRTAIEQLRKMGHDFEDKNRRQGDAHSIWVDPETGTYYGVADTRISGKAVGY